MGDEQQGHGVDAKAALQGRADEYVRLFAKRCRVCTCCHAKMLATMAEVLGCDLRIAFLTGKHVAASELRAGGDEQTLATVMHELDQLTAHLRDLADGQNSEGG